MSSEVLTIRVGSEIKATLENLGKVLHRSKSYLAQKAIEEFLKKNAWQIEELQLAEKEIEEGNFISNEEVNDYLSSWGVDNNSKK